MMLVRFPLPLTLCATQTNILTLIFESTSAYVQLGRQVAPTLRNMVSVVGDDSDYDSEEGYEGLLPDCFVVGV